MTTPNPQPDSLDPPGLRQWVGFCLAFFCFWGSLYVYMPTFPVYAESLGELKPGFEIAQFVMCNIDDDLERALMPVKTMLSFYIGGMGAKKHNFHTELMGRMGFEAEANKIQDLFMEGKRAEAIAAVPDQFADEVSLCGPRERVIERIQAWEETPVTSLLVATQEIETLRQMAEIIL